MAILLTFAFLLTANLVLISADDCKCTEDIPQDQLEEMWKFLSEHNPDVLPGELTEFIPCKNCIEQSRRKRKIQEDSLEEFRRERSIFPQYSKLRFHEDNQRNKCPIGYKKFFWRCLKF